MPFDYQAVQGAFKAVRESATRTALSQAAVWNELQQERLSEAAASLAERGPAVPRIELDQYAQSYARTFSWRQSADLQRLAPTGAGQAHRLLTNCLVPQPGNSPIVQEKFHAAVATLCRSLDLTAIPAHADSDAAMDQAWTAGIRSAVYDSAIA